MLRNKSTPKMLHMHREALWD